MKENIPTNEALKERIKNQELEIERLSGEGEFLKSFKFFIEESNVLVCFFSMDTILKDINPAFLEILGYPKEELVGKSVLSYLHPNDLEKSINELRSLELGNPSINFENRFIKKNGDSIYIVWTAKAVTATDIYAIGRDITQFKTIQEDLVKSQNFLNHAQKMAKMGSWEFTFKTKMISWSDELYHLFEIEKKEGQDLYQEYINHFSKEDVEHFQKKIDQLLIDKKPFELEQSRLLLGDRIKWVNETVYPLLDEEGTVFAIRANVQDVTHKKEMEAIVKAKEEAERQYQIKVIEEQSNAKFKNYIENAPDVIFVLDEKGNYKEVNQAAVDFTGYSREELLTKRFGDLSESKFKGSLKNKFKALLKIGKLDGEVQIVNKSGKKMWSSYRIIRIAKNRFLGFVRDITTTKTIELQIKKNEERFKAMIENNEAIISLLDKNFNTFFRSASAERILGWENSQYDSSSGSDYIHPTDLKVLHQTFGKLLETPNELIPVTFRFKHKDGHYVWLEGTFINLLEDQNINAIVSNLRDVTERVLALQKIAKANRLYFYLSQINQMIARTTIEEDLFKETCQIAINFGKFRLVRICLYENQSGKLLPRMVLGQEDIDTAEIEKEAFGDIFKNGNVITANLREGRDAVFNDIEVDYNNEEVAKVLLEYGCRSFMVLPIKRYDEVIGTITYFAGEKDFFDQEERNLLKEATEDLSFALEKIENDLLRKKAEEAVYQSEKRYNALTTNSPVGIYKTDLYGLATYVNPKWSEITGITYEKAMGSGWAGGIHPEDQQRIYEYVAKKDDFDSVSHIEFRFLRPDGITRWVLGQSIPELNSKNEKIGYIGTLTDITDLKKVEGALKKSEERYRGVMNVLDAGIIVFNSDLSVKMNNARAAELLEIGSDYFDDFVNNLDRDYDLINENNSLMAVNEYPLNRVLKTKKAVANLVEGLQNRKSKKNVWLSVSGFPILDNNGEIEEIVMSFTDITERKLKDIEVKKAKEEAEAASKYKTDFLANMSHEIRTPLNGIMGFTSLLTQSKLEDDQLEYVNTINDSANTLLNIVNDILDFSKIEAGKLELKPEKKDLMVTLKKVISLFKYEANRKDISLVLDIKEGVPQYVITDSLRLNQILVNLIGNAIKFTDAGEVRLEVCSKGMNTDDTIEISFAVKDTGIGIKQKSQSKIFESFEQGDSSTNRKFGGTGLGLAISNQLLSLMGSSLHLKSKFGKGSNFYFTLNLKIPDMKRSDLIEEGNIDSEPIIIHGKKKILIVEDNKINLLLAKKLVHKIVPESILIEARDGQEAVREYLKDKPDIILMDIQMPHKNGFEATIEIRNIEKESLKSKEAETPIVALTAGIFEEEKEKCFSAGMNDYIAKPIELPILEKALEKWLSYKSNN